jgi:hypothetical protein
MSGPRKDPLFIIFTDPLLSDSSKAPIAWIPIQISFLKRDVSWRAANV